MFVVPPVPAPVTIPVDEPMVAINVLLLLHVPPPTPSLSDVVRPTHTLAVPRIAVGATSMVTIAV